MSACLAVALLAGWTAPNQAAGIAAATQTPANIFQESERAVFALEGAGEAAEWQVEDWHGDTVAAGTLSGPQLELPPLPLGYYELRFRSAGSPEWSEGTPFARVPDKATRQRDPASFVALDAAFSFLTRDAFFDNALQPADTARVAADIVELSGVSMIRERSWWADGTHPRAGVFDWSFLEKNAALLSERGIRIQNMFEGVPSWARKGDGTYDLWALQGFTEAAGRQFAGRATAWEIWNEIDAKPSIPVWDYVSAHKAAYLGFKKASADIAVLNAPVANPRTHRAFLDLIFENGIGDYIDGFSYHTYAAPEGYSEEMGVVREVLDRHRLSAKPIWITEAGWRLAGRRAPLQANGRMTEHDREQMNTQAERLVKAQVMLHALGARKVFSFVLFPFNENNGRDCWGLLRWDWKVKPAYVALATLTAQVGNSVLLPHAPIQPGVHSYLFQPAAQAGAATTAGQTLVAWSETEAVFAVASRSPRLDVVDLMGKMRTIEPGEDGRFHVPVGVNPVYLRGDFSAEKSAPAAKEGELPAVDRPIVLRARFGSDFSVGQKSVRLNGKDSGDFTVEVFNFAAEPRQITLRALGGGYSVRGLPATLTVPAGQRVELPLRLTLAAAPRAPGELVRLTIGGESGSQKVSPVTVPVGTSYFAALEKRSKVTARPFPAEDLTRWKANSSGTMQISRDAKEKAVRFKVSFPEGKAVRWIYPELALKLPDESLANSVGISFEIKADAIARDPGEVLVMALTDKEIAENGFLRFPYRITADWQTVEIIWADNTSLRDPSEIRILRVGCNPQQSTFGFRVRNLQVFFKK